MNNEDVQTLQKVLRKAAERFNELQPDVSSAYTNLADLTLDRNGAITPQGLRMAATQEVTFHHPLQAAERQIVLSSIESAINVLLANQFNAAPEDVAKASLQAHHVN